MKIDIEGFEYYAFKGALQFLKKFKIPYVVSEYNVDYIKRLDITLED